MVPPPTTHPFRRLWSSRLEPPHLFWQVYAYGNKRVLLSVLDFHREAKQLLVFLLQQDRKEAQQQQLDVIIARP